MRTRLAVLALLTAAANVSFGAAPQAGPEESALTLRVKGAPTKDQPLVRFEGKTTLPNDAVLKGTLYRLDERAASGRLAPEPVEAGRAVAQVAERKLAFQFPAERPGFYRLTVEISDDRQDPAHLAALRKLPVTRWTFEGAAWGDGWAGQLGTRLAEVDHFAHEALALIDEFAQAAVSKEIWTDRRPKLEKEADRILKKFEEGQVPQSYPAAFKELRDTVRNLRGSAGLFQFGDDGKCRGPFNYMTKKPAQTLHQEDFTFERVKKYIEDAGAIAGRELGLWLIKDVRRSGEKRSSVLDAVKSGKTHAGVRDHAARLEAAIPAELDDLEAALRGGPARPAADRR